jgi:hypothetical protein
MPPFGTQAQDYPASPCASALSLAIGPAIKLLQIAGIKSE